MKKILLLSSLLLFTLSARENPFFPSEGQNDIPVTTNITEEIPPLKRAAMTLPSTARVVESFTVTYKNLDGSVAHKSVKLGNSIDWHLPLFLTQSYSEHNNAIQKKSTPKIETQQSHKSANILHNIESLKFVKFSSSNKEFKIITSDKLLRDFILTRPHRIVADFKRESDIPSYLKKDLKTEYFKELRVGNHKGYYRVVITLDGYYRYKKITTNNGITFKLI